MVFARAVQQGKVRAKHALECTTDTTAFARHGETRKPPAPREGRTDGSHDDLRTARRDAQTACAARGADGTYEHRKGDCK
ncbi:MAG: hypothetical protein IJS15_12195 [Victivallales bacterium]|nr:hypothetical protein [Victivallales bacterium]